MDTYELRKILYHIPVNGDVCAKDLLPEKKPLDVKAYIINTDNSDEPGEHWVALYFRGNQAIFFDSYEMSPEEDYILPFIKRNSRSWIQNTEPLQSPWSKNCGRIFRLVPRRIVHIILIIGPVFLISIFRIQQTELTIRRFSPDHKLSQRSMLENSPVAAISSWNAHVYYLNVSSGVVNRGAYADQRFPDLFRLEFNETNGNYTEFWSRVRELAGDDCLYPRSYDVSQVTTILRTGKIIHADLFTERTSLKLKIEYEGNQSAIFKVLHTERLNNKSHGCNWGCEQPEYEVTAFTLNRMFDLRNMPYTTGRVLSWSELEPVASPRLKEFIQLQDDNSVCVDWGCGGATYKRHYCFENGNIPGAVVYFIGDRKIRFMSAPNQLYHGYHIMVADKNDLRRLPGDKTFCKKFRKDERYQGDGWFLDVVDIAVFDYLMSHKDAKHTYLRERENDRIPEFNVMFDFGLAFCHTDDLAILAPLTQCCRMRSRLFRAMGQYRDTLEESFMALTKDDPLYPLLLPNVMADLKKKLKQTFAIIDLCRSLDGDSDVFIDV